MTTNPDELEEVLRSLVGIVDGEEPVDEFSHALQCARHAQLAHADGELVTAALLHDVARSPLISSNYPGAEHEEAGADWLRPRFGERVAWLVGAHVAAKLYFLASEPGYLERLSGESMKSALHQRARSTTDFVDHPFWPDALRLRRWDDDAKQSGVRLPDPVALLEIARQYLR